MRLELSLKKPAKVSQRLWVISVLVSLGKSMLYFLRLGYFFLQNDVCSDFFLLHPLSSEGKRSVITSFSLGEG